MPNTNYQIAQVATVMATGSCYKFDAPITFNHDKKSRCLNLVALIVWLACGFLIEKGIGEMLACEKSICKLNERVFKSYRVFSVFSAIFLVLSSLISLEVGTAISLEIYGKLFDGKTHAFLNYGLKRKLLIVIFICMTVCCASKTYLSLKPVSNWSKDWFGKEWSVFDWIRFIGQWVCLAGVGLAIGLDKSSNYVGENSAGGNQNASPVGDQNSGNVVRGSTGNDRTNTRIPSVFESSNLALPTVAPPAYGSSSTSYGTGAIDMDKYGSGNNYSSVFEWSHNAGSDNK